MRSNIVLTTVIAVALAAGCATPNQRVFYRDAIEQFSSKLPSSSARCWLTPDLVGPSAGSNAIAEEVFTNYLISNGLCRVVEQHPDVVGGYTWPQSDVCPCPAKVKPCGACGGAGGSGSAGVRSGGVSLLGGGNTGFASVQASDPLLDRYKKRTLVDKVVIFRIDKLTQDKAVIWFRVSDAHTAIVEAARTVTIERAKPARRRE